jgi:hypothetical protein
MDDEAMARLEGGLAAAVQAAAASKPNSKERKQQMLNFKLRCAVGLSHPVAEVMRTAPLSVGLWRSCLFRAPTPSHVLQDCCMAA